MTAGQFFRKLFTGRQTKKLKGVRKMQTDNKVLAIGKELDNKTKEIFQEMLP